MRQTNLLVRKEEAGEEGEVFVFCLVVDMIKKNKSCYSCFLFFCFFLFSICPFPRLYISISFISVF